MTQNKLKEILDYNPDTGVFVWRKRVALRVKIGNKAGYFNSQGYIIIRIFGVNYKAHRLAWLYMYGEWPKNGIDHINGITSDNRITNLRDVPHLVNQRNQSKYKTNTSGYTGVHWHKTNKKWCAQINDNLGNKINLGYFNKESLEEAIETRKKAEIQYGGYSNRHGLSV